MEETLDAIWDISPTHETLQSLTMTGTTTNVLGPAVLEIKRLQTGGHRLIPLLCISDTRHCTWPEVHRAAKRAACLTIGEMLFWQLQILELSQAPGDGHVVLMLIPTGLIDFPIKNYDVAVVVLITSKKIWVMTGS
ncbi:hypothetical protein FRC04_011474 [Tulasnella sp. 424]|nr:hypothetical protein FRC04_011474 [Tulasnella sp. 424]